MAWTASQAVRGLWAADLHKRWTDRWTNLRKLCRSK